jgi:folate-binding protein YgfZ
MTVQNTTRPGQSTLNAYHAARAGLAFRRVHERGVLRVSGADRLPWLQGLLTNDVAPLAGSGTCYAAWLTPQGRMITDMVVLDTGRDAWLDVPAPLAGDLAKKLDLLIFAEDVRVADVSSEVCCVGVYGPSAAAALAAALGVPSLSERDIAALGASALLAPDDDEIVAIVRATRAGVDGLHVYLSVRRAAGLEEALSHGGGVALDDGTSEVLRVEAAIPAFLVDMGDDTIPLEAGLDAALSYTKGCYVGQEIIIRIRDRGHGRVARRLVGLLIAGDASNVADSVSLDGRAVGKMTSVVRSPALDRVIALAMLYRDAAAPGTELTLGDGTRATVVELPFQGN